MGSSNLHSIKRGRTHHLTLMEIVVAFGLISIVLFTLFSCFTTYSKMQMQMETIRPIIIQKQMMYQRLSQIFSLAQTQSFQAVPQEEDANPTLTFSFDNGYDRSPEFSDDVKACIYLNHSSELVLQLCSNVDQSKRKEILQNHVHSVSWDLETKDLLILELQNKEKEMDTFAFLLPSSLEQGYPLKKKEPTL